MAARDSSAEAGAAPSGDPDEEPSQPAAPLQLVPRIQRANAPIDLAAMRELANMTARGAIDKHSQGRWSRAAIEKLAICAGVAVVGVGLLFWADSARSPLHMLGIAALILAIYLLWQAFSLFGHMWTVGRRNKKFLRAESAQHKPEALPGSDTKELAPTAVADSISEDAAPVETTSHEAEPASNAS